MTQGLPVRIVKLEIDSDVVFATLSVGGEEVLVMAEANLARRQLTLSELHIHGPGPNTMGLSGLRGLAVG